VRVPSLTTLRQGFGELKKRLSRRALILLYHRVAESGSDPWQLAVTAQHFEEHLQILKRYARPIPLRKLSAYIRDGGLPRRSVIVTFDDGYADNLLNAKPLLEKHAVPATIFVTTGYTGQDREFWWDELERVLLQPGRLPRELRLSVRGSDYYWDLGESADYDETTQRRHLGWRAWAEDGPTVRHSIYRSIWQLMHPMSDDERRPIREELLLWAGVTGSARPTHRTLTGGEITDLSRDRLIEVGAHTVTHPQLSALSAESAERQIGESKACLEEMLGEPVTSFAYPFGRECDYSSETVGLVQQAGFDCACTTSVGAVQRGSNRFQLPRVHVPDMDGESFERLCSRLLSD
jgi:peptidoglycan/xylan/chitin deacetylase (PgdA/CDA1 family)